MFLWTSVKTLICIKLSLTVMPANVLGQTSSEACIPTVLWMIVCYSSQFLMVFQIWYFINAEISHGHSLWPWLFIHFANKAMPTDFKGQTITEALIPPILPMILRYTSPCFLQIWNSVFINVIILREILLWALLCSSLDLTAIPANFLMSNRPRSACSPYFSDKYFL